MSSQIEDISNNQQQQEQSLPDPKRIKLTNEFETNTLIKVKSCPNNSDQQQSTQHNNSSNGSTTSQNMSNGQNGKHNNNGSREIDEGLYSRQL